ncbi:MAG: zinc ribbon domain-containing protein, partial [Candidatus Thorarchaeota archaeon]
MGEKVECKVCGAALGKGSTFCIKCGTRIGEGPAETISPDESGIDEIPSLEDSTLESTEPAGTTLEFSEGDLGVPDKIEDEVTLPPETEIGWEAEASAETEPTLPDDILPPLEDSPPDEISEELEYRSDTSVDPTSEVPEGMPFKEIEPPRVFAEAPDETNEIRSHLFPQEEEHSATREAVQHLFPKGRGDSSDDFIDIVVGKPKKIGITQQLGEIVAPDCPDCGKSVTSDGFEYPNYVYGAMGKARVEAGIAKLKENEHEEAIELFEKGKVLFERGEDSKSVQ